MAQQLGHKQFLIEHYKSLAGKYDEHYNRENRVHLNKIVAINKFLNVPQSARVLELGVGSGLHARHFLEANAGKNLRFTGSDLSHHMVVDCRKRLEGLPGTSYVRSDGENLPFPDASFDAVFITGSMHHFEDIEAGIREIVRITKPGGRFSIMEPNWFFPSNYLASKLMATGKNLGRIKASNFRKWFSRLPKARIEIHRFAYTPPFPRFLHGVYDQVDRWMHKIPGLRRMSVMLFVQGEKLE